ncbi:hypothetical protein CHUAL_009504 [Chamberlinius hualienensis]
MSPIAVCPVASLISPLKPPALPPPSLTSSKPSFSTFTFSPPTSNSTPSSPAKRTPPPPPPRRSLSSPSDVISPLPDVPKTSPADATNFTVTTTVTFHVNRCVAALPIEVEEEMDKSKSEESVIMIPEPMMTTSTTSTLSRRSFVMSELESPPGYHCSSLADKISDYEDIWVNKTSPEELKANQTDLEKALARFSLNGSKVGNGKNPKLFRTHGFSDPNLSRYSTFSNSNLSDSSCNSESDKMLELSSGIVNNGFESSSSQILETGTTLASSNPLKSPEMLKDFQELLCNASPENTLNQNLTSSSWPLDFSWEFRGTNSNYDQDSSASSSSIDHDNFLTEDEEVALVEIRTKPVGHRSNFRIFQKTSSMFNSSSMMFSGKLAASTVEQLLTEKEPRLKVPELRPLTHSNLLRVSEYDNLSDECPSTASSVQMPAVVPPRISEGVEVRVRNVPSEAGSSMTEFSEPWDSHRWEMILMNAAALNRVTASGHETSTTSSVTSPLSPTSDVTLRSQLQSGSGTIGAVAKVDEEMDLQSVSSVTLDGTDEEASKWHCKIPVLPCLLSLRRKDRRQGRPIRDYVFRMAQDKNLIFGRHIENFIACTFESHETNPHVVMRNIRQFMSGMANYLVNSGEGKFSQLVQEQRAKLQPNEFLNLDAILEGVLHRIVVKPLKQHIYQLFVKAYSANGAVAMLSDSIKFARTKTPEQLGLKPHLHPPKDQIMEKIRCYFSKLQKAYSPLKKLENLLAAISFIYQSILQKHDGEHQSIGADDFLPFLLYVLVHCGLIAAEVEAEYMWGLLHPSLLSGEAGYYLTTLSSAVHVLKNLHRCHGQKLDQINKRSDQNGERKVASCLCESDGFLKILIPNEQNGSIMFKTVPVRPNMTSKDICRMVAHRLSVTNPQDYALFKLFDGEEFMLSDSCYPWMIGMEMAGAGSDISFVYKRVDAKIAWPVSLKKA